LPIRRKAEKKAAAGIAVKVATVPAKPVAHWHAEHMQFARLLDLLESEVAAFHLGDTPDYELMRDIVHYLHYYPDRYHHPREDVAFERLLRHAPAMELPINRLLQEHRVIASAGEELLRRLEEVAEGVLMSRATMEAAASTYLVYYRHHIATEEREVLPRAAQLLHERDWEAVAAAMPQGVDPLFGQDCEPRYRELKRRIEQRTNAVAPRGAG
jgi:hemerythrin-like domain-containing protein